MDANLDQPAHTLARRTADLLRRDILGATLAPGSRLGMEELRTRYGAGASPLREALSQLAAEGLVLRVDQRGFRVAAADPAELRDLIATRCLAETAAIRESVSCGDTAWEERLLVAHHRMSQSARSEEAGRFVSNPVWENHHRAFHIALIEACGARALIEFCGELHDRAMRFRLLSNTVAWPQRDVAAEHAEILSAALDRRGDDAAMLLAAHYRRTGAFVESALETAPACQSQRRPAATGMQSK
ncbi:MULTISPECIES: GntR family transcriptional regulator [unclassified Caballeronia]|jgi:GntR family carbon starvation induced transcriptional regulator|uniref:GntR family transcriptional regulator n=1 Tax=unclassified Caballeronia TaxID=2646786 RepID=UPI003ED0AC3C